MANTRYIAVRPLEPGKPVDVLERDEAGALVGAWHGYWNFKRGTVSLYPNPRNRFVTWPGGVLPQKRVVSDRNVKILNSKFEIRNDRSSSPTGKDGPTSRRQGKSEIEGQEKIKL